MIGGEPYTLGLFDISGQNDYVRLRPLSYPQTDVFLVCFSVVYPASLETVIEEFVPEITHHCPKTPFLLVGTQIDLRDDASTIERLSKAKLKPISIEHAEKVARKLKAVKYVECCALTQKDVRNVFDEAILAALEPPPVSRKRGRFRFKRRTPASEVGSLKQKSTTLTPEVDTLTLENKSKKKNFKAPEKIFNVATSSNQLAVNEMEEQPKKRNNEENLQGPTMNDFGLSDDQLDELIEESDMFYLARCFGAWTLYTGMPGLQLTRGEQHTIIADPNLVNNQMKMKESLTIWQSRNPILATFRNLLQILLILEEQDVAMEISQYLKSPLRLENKITTRTTDSNVIAIPREEQMISKGIDQLQVMPGALTEERSRETSKQTCVCCVLF